MLKYLQMPDHPGPDHGVYRSVTKRYRCPRSQNQPRVVDAGEARGSSFTSTGPPVHRTSVIVVHRKLGPPQYHCSSAVESPPTTPSTVVGKNHSFIRITLLWQDPVHSRTKRLSRLAPKTGTRDTYSILGRLPSAPNMFAPRPATHFHSPSCCNFIDSTR